MGRARIISQETYDPYRKWKIVGVTSAFIAAASLVYFTTGPDEAPVQAIQKTAGPYAGQNHQSAIADVPSNGSKALPFPQQSTQAPTNDMWGLLQRAENQAEQSRYEEDISYSKSLGDDSCQMFWVAHMNYQNMRAATDPVSKLDYYLYIPIQPAEFLASRDYGVAYSHELGVHNHGTAALTELVRDALPELRRRLQLNPEDKISEEKYIYARFLASHYNLKVPHEPLDQAGYDALKEQAKLPELRRAMQVLTMTPQPANLTTLESDAYVDHARLLARINRDDDEYRQIREALYLTSQQADILAMQATSVVDEQLRQHTAKMQQYMQNHNAPCTYK